MTMSTVNNNLETFTLIWLDAAVNISRENQEAQQQLRSIINQVITFEDPNLCEKYIQSVGLYDRIILIVNDRLGQKVVPHIHQIEQVLSIYIHCKTQKKNENWPKSLTKIKAVTVQLDDLISRIKSDQKYRMKVEEPLTINIFMINDIPDQPISGSNKDFIHSLLLIDVLLRMNPSEVDKKELIKLCKTAYKNNKTELNVLREFQKEYSPGRALWWYTRDSFLSKMLNKALRLQNINVLFLFRFFLRDIHRELKQNQCQLPIQAYCSQILSDEELANFENSIGGFISINTFFSATTNRQQAVGFLKNSNISDDLYRVLFKIDADPQAVTTKPFIKINSSNTVVEESEILFMAGSIFRLEDVQQNKDKTWLIRLTLCNDNEDQFRIPFEHMKKIYAVENDEVTLSTFAELVRRMSKCNSVEKFYRRLLAELPSNDPLISDLYYSLGLMLKDKKDFDSSLQYIHKSLKLKLQTSPLDYRKTSDCYNAIGNIYQKKNHYNIALSWYQKGMELLKQENPVNHLKMAHFYTNIAIIYEEREEYVKALDFNKKALTIREQYLSSNHPDIVLSYNKIGHIRCYLGHYDLALEHFNQSLNIRLRSHSPDHPHVAKSYRNIGLVLENKAEPNQALTYLQKAATIRRQSLHSEHPALIKIEKDIKRVASSCA